MKCQTQTRINNQQGNILIIKNKGLIINSEILPASHSTKELIRNVVVLSILILHYNLYYFHFTLQEPC